MFDADDFRRVINNTVDHMEELKTAHADDIEEIQLRIDSNIQALQLMGSSIVDPDLRAQAESLIKSLNSGIKFTELEKETAHIRKHSSKEKSDLIENAMYQSALRLKAMAHSFSTSLRTDSKVMDNLKDKMNKNSAENTRNLKSLVDKGFHISSTTVLIWGFVLFIVMYFIIKFL